MQPAAPGPLAAWGKAWGASAKAGIAVAKEIALLRDAKAASLEEQCSQKDAKITELEATLETVLGSLPGHLVEKDGIVASLDHAIAQKEERISVLEVEKEDGRRLAKQLEERIAELEAEKEEGQKLASERVERIASQEAEKDRCESLAQQRIMSLEADIRRCRDLKDGIISSRDATIALLEADAKTCRNQLKRKKGVIASLEVEDERNKSTLARKEAEIDKWQMKLNEEVTNQGLMVASVERIISEWRKRKGSSWFGDAGAARALEEIEALLASSKSAGAAAIEGGGGGGGGRRSGERFEAVADGSSSPDRDLRVREGDAAEPLEEALEAIHAVKRRCCRHPAGGPESS